MKLTKDGHLACPHREALPHVLSHKEGYTVVSDTYVLRFTTRLSGEQLQQVVYNTVLNSTEHYPPSLAHTSPSAENQKEMVNALEKLVICIEMENWQKAENFAATVKGLIPAEQKEIYREAFRLELIVRKADKKKALEQYEEVEKEVFEYYQRL